MKGKEVKKKGMVDEMEEKRRKKVRKKKKGEIKERKIESNKQPTYYIRSKSSSE